jgi:hypothetical protein
MSPICKQRPRTQIDRLAVFSKEPGSYIDEFIGSIPGNRQLKRKRHDGWCVGGINLRLAAPEYVGLAADVFGGVAEEHRGFHSGYGFLQVSKP